MWFSSFILKNLARRPMRSSLTVIAIAIAIGAVVSLVGIARGFEDSFLELYGKLNIDLMVVSTGGGKGRSSAISRQAGRTRSKSSTAWRRCFLGLSIRSRSRNWVHSIVVINGWEPETLAFKHLGSA